MLWYLPPRWKLHKEASHHSIKQCGLSVRGKKCFPKLLGALKQLFLITWCRSTEAEKSDEQMQIVWIELKSWAQDRDFRSLTHRPLHRHSSPYPGTAAATLYSHPPSVDLCNLSVSQAGYPRWSGRCVILFSVTFVLCRCWATQLWQWGILGHKSGSFLHFTCFAFILSVL